MYSPILVLSEKRMWYEVQKNIGEQTTSLIGAK
jgi:hypothetical protein